MRTEELIRACRSRLVCNHAVPVKKEIDGIVTDSRLANAANAFVCLVGARADSHTFAKDAYAQGCRCFIAQKPLDLPDDADVYFTEDTRAALPYLADAAAGFPSRGMHLVGITGTKGKTSVAFLIRQILERSGIPCGLIGTCGIDWPGHHLATNNTTPDPLVLQDAFRKMKESGVGTVVMEVSSQSVLQHRIDNLRFAEAVFTNLSHDHVGATEHPTFENYKACKKQLFSLCDRAILNRDDPYYPEFRDACRCPVLTCGENGESDIKIGNIADGPGFSTGFSLNGPESSVRMPGDFNVSNAALAAAAAQCCGVSLNDSARILPTLSVPGRFEIIDCLPGRTFVIDYAHNGASTKAILETVRSRIPKRGRITVLFGSVGGRTETRREEIATVCAALADRCIITSDNPDFEDPGKIIDEIASYFPKTFDYVKIPDRAEAIRYAVANSLPGDTTLLLGKGHETYQIVNGKKEPFCEKEILSAAAKQYADSLGKETL